MLNSVITIRRIRRSKLEKFKAWLSLINNDLQSSAIDTLKSENCAFEFFHIVKIKQNYYAVGYMCFLNGGRRKNTSARIKAIDVNHKKMIRECLYAKKEDIYFGYELSNFLPIEK
ncbi:hypothetical protein BK004_04505 [bacterium CG10_46_32]|nr:MAG: hypothetical protein BK004_04505 [bacterium CG10_46_32]PIR55703.1 MAG: hypothetical protein COU73_04545 [Parcubacteria group bacterium CG10_big_fil_rev_8_21_14_0_10_46_32]